MNEQLEPMENTKPRHNTTYVPGSELRVRGGDYFKHQGRLWRVSQVMTRGLMGQWVSNDEYDRKKRPAITPLHVPGPV